MTKEKLRYIAELRQAREKLQDRLNLWEVGQLEVGCTHEQAAAAAKLLRRAIAEYDRLIANSRALTVHSDESIHLF